MKQIFKFFVLVMLMAAGTLGEVAGQTYETRVETGPACWLNANFNSPVRRTTIDSEGFIVEPNDWVRGKFVVESGGVVLVLKKPLTSGLNHFLCNSEVKLSGNGTSQIFTNTLSNCSTTEIRIPIPAAMLPQIDNQELNYGISYENMGTSCLSGNPCAIASCRISATDSKYALLTFFIKRIPASSPTTIATPTISPSSTTFTGSQSVSISTSTTGATIYYTTNGSNPTSSSTQYSGAFSVTATTTVKAFAEKSGMTDSGVATETYTLSTGGGGGASLSASPTSLNFDNTGSPARTVNVSASSGLDWQASANESWITVNSGSGTSNGSFTVSCSNNSGTSARSGSVTISGTGGVSDVTISVNQDATVPPPCPTNLLASSNSPVIVGSSLILTATISGDISGGSFSWTGANGFTSTDQNPIIASAASINSGIYTVTFTKAGCTTQTASTTVTVNGLPNLQLIGNITITPNPLIKGDNGYLAAKVKNTGTADYTGTVYLSWHRADAGSTFITDLATKVNLAVGEETLLEKPNSPILSNAGMYRVIIKYADNGGYTTIQSVDIEVKDLAAVVPDNVLSPLIGDLIQGAYCANQTTSTQTKPWSFWQRGNCHGAGHGVGEGIGAANDTHAWDCNKNYPSHNADKDVPVYAVEDGEIVSTGNWSGNTYGQLLIKHTNTDGTFWYSGYLHLKNKKAGTVTKTTIIGYISKTSPQNITEHLHFAVYYRKNNNYVSVNRTIIPRLSAETKIATLKEIRPTTISAGQIFAVGGHSFEPNKPVILSFSGTNNASFEVNTTTTPQGYILYGSTFPANQPVGFWKVAVKNVVTNPTYLGFKVVSTTPTAISKLKIHNPTSASVVQTGSKLNIVWNDKLVGQRGNRTFAVTNGQRRFTYIVQYSFNGGAWVSFPDAVAGMDDIEKEKSFIKSVQPNIAGNYNIRVTDVLDNANFDETGVFTVNSTTKPVKLLWDDFNATNRSTQDVKGVAADGTARIKLELNGVTSKDASNVTAKIIGDVGETRTAILGKLMQNCSKLPDEANVANNTTAQTVCSQADGKFRFWYVAPDDFSGSTSHDNLAERKVKVEFTITYNNGTIRTVSQDVIIVRPPLMQVHGLASHFTVWNDFNQNFNAIFNTGIYKAASRIHLGAGDYFRENADMLNGLRTNNTLNAPETQNFWHLVKSQNDMGYATIRVDYLCHSMGGQVAKAASLFGGQNFYHNNSYGKGFINKLITINTPHNGSPIANLVTQVLNGLNDKIQRSQSLTDKGNYNAAAALLKEFLSKNTDDDFFNLNYMMTVKKNQQNFSWQELKDVVFGDIGFYTVAPTGAIIDLQNNAKGVQYQTITIPNQKIATHIIASDVAGDIPQKYVDMLLQFTEVLFKISDLLPATITIGNQVFKTPDYIKSIIDKANTVPYDRVEAAKMVIRLTAVLYNSVAFEIDTDLVVSIKSQLAGLDRNTSYVKVFANGLSPFKYNHLSIHKQPEVATHVAGILNTPINSNKFGNIPAFNINAGRTENPSGGRVESNNRPVYLNFDSLNVRLLNVPPTAKIGDTLNIHITVRDTAKLQHTELFFINNSQYNFEKTNYYEYNLIVPSTNLGKQLVCAKAYYDYGDSARFVYDTLSLVVTSPDVVTQLSTQEKIIYLTVGQRHTPNYYVTTDNFVAKPNPNLITNPNIENSSIISFDKGNFEAKAVGGSRVIVNYKGSVDTLYFIVRSPCNLMATVIPQSRPIICEDDFVMLEAIATDSVTYQWYKDGVAIAGATDKLYPARTAGNYTVQIRKNSCSYLSNELVVELLALPKLNLGKKLYFCKGDSLKLSIAGFVTYKWFNNSTDSTIIIRNPGKYWLTVSNSNGCFATDTVEILHDSLTATYEVKHISCYGNRDATAKVTPKKNVGTVTISWQHDSSLQSFELRDLRKGKYPFTIKDDICVFKDTITIIEPDTIRATFVVTHNTRFGERRGKINTIIRGGWGEFSGRYKTTWRDSTNTIVSTNEDLQNLASGLYKLEITDTLCPTPKRYAVLIKSPDSLYIKQTIIKELTCIGAKDGEFTFIYHGGTEPVRMVSNLTNDTINLVNNTYTFKNLKLTAAEPIEFVLIDANGLSINKRYTFKEATEQPKLSYPKIEYCISDPNPKSTLVGIRNGKFVATPLGLAIDEKTGEINIQKSQANNYTISYIVANPMCTVNTVKITIFGFPFKNLNNGSQIACEKLTLDAANNNMPNVSYKWSTGETSQKITVTKSGTYIVTINSGLCQILDTIKVQISNLVVTTKATHLRGNGNIANGEIDVTSIVGNIGTATIMWADIPSVQRKRTGLKAGIYKFTVKDTLCSRDYQIEVKAPIVLRVTASKTDDTGCGGANGEIFLEISGNGNETVTINGIVVKDARLGKLKAGLYKWTVKDTTGQELKGDVLLASADSLSAKIRSFDASCTNDGKVILDITGGRSPYIIQYADPITGSVKTATSNEILGLSITSNEYIFVVTDATGCKVVVRTRIRKAAISNLIIADSSTICEGNSTYFTVKYKGNLYPYSFSYSANREIFTVSGIMDSVYKVEVAPKITTLYRLTDLRYGANCLGTFGGQSFVTVNPLPILLNAQASSENCDNKDATILLSDKDVKAGKAPFLFAIQQVDSKDSLKFAKTMKFDSLAAGNYRVFVKEANGCIYQYPKTIEIKNLDCAIDFRKLPNTISPNGDDINDTFVIPNAQFYPEMTLEVQDRVGRMIYKGIYKDWNPNETNETIGVYFYQIILGNGRTYQRFINVIR